MNAIISLCHFCEIHGPKILFCTQPLRQEANRGQLEHVDAENENITNGSGRRGKSPSVSSSTSSVAELQSPSHPGPSSGPSFSSSSSSSKTDHCEGCYSVHTGYVTHDEDAQVSYVSTQQPHHPQIFSRIRQGCIRSLSCEVCQGREGPIFFGTEENGYVLSYTFYVKDSQARGFQRLYSILVVMMDKVYLLNSWPFLVPNLQTVVEWLQGRAVLMYEEEQSRCPQRAYRLQGPSMNPSNFMHQRGGGNKPARSLTELTADENVFKLLHASFMWILKACGNRLSETLLEGPPTEDSMIDLEKQEETEEGFIKLFSKKVEDEGSGQPPSSSDEELAGGEEEDYVVEDAGTRSIKTLRQLRQALGSSRFRVLAHHAMIGNQIIVSGPEKNIVKSILNSLKNLLPKGCCRVINYSSVYEESWRCNFLGLAPDVALPHHTQSSELFVLLELVPRGEEAEPASEEPASMDSDKSDPDGAFEPWDFRMSSSITLPEKGPVVLSRMELALRNQNLSDAVVEQCFTCIKEEWMNKVKVLFTFTKAGGNRSEEDTKRLLQIVGAQEEDKQLMKFWMTGLSVQYRTHILASSRHPTPTPS